MLHHSDRWVAFSLAAVLTIGLGILAGCKQKPSAPPSGAEAEATTEPSPQEDAVLQRMRQQASMPSGPQEQRNAANVPPPAAGPAAATAPTGGFSGPKELFEAAKNGDLETVKRIFMSGKMILLTDDQGASPMHWAAYGGHIHVLEYLLDDPGFSVNEKNRDNVTPLHWAASGGHRDAVDFLVSRGAEIDARDNDGRTPLFVAAAWGQTDVVDYLIQKGADINATDNRGDTPLSAARRRRSLEVVKMLIDHGAQRTRTPTTTKAS